MYLLILCTCSYAVQGHESKRPRKMLCVSPLRRNFGHWPKNCNALQSWKKHIIVAHNHLKRQICACLTHFSGFIKMHIWLETQGWKIGMIDPFCRYFTILKSDYDNLFQLDGRQTWQKLLKLPTTLSSSSCIGDVCSYALAPTQTLNVTRALSSEPSSALF